MSKKDYDINIIEKLEPSVKERILYFFNNIKFDEIWVSSVLIADETTGKEVKDYLIQGRVVPSMTYELGDLEWTSDLVYHFDKYDVKLPPELKKFAMSCIERPTETGASFNQ